MHRVYGTISKTVVAAAAMALFGAACTSSESQPAPQANPAQAVQPAYPQPQAGQVPQAGYPQQPGQVAQPGYPPQVPGQPAQPQVQPGVQPVQPAQPTQPTQQNPLGALVGALGQMAGQGGAQQQGGQPPQAVVMIPWQSLANALPVSAPGWTLKGQVSGESANIMGISVSKASCDLTQNNLSADVEIVDTTMNPMIAMPFNIARSVQIDSSEERHGPINFGVYPGVQKFEKNRNSAEIIVMVHNRVMVTVRVKNATSEAEGVNLAQYVNYAMLAQLVGG